MGIKAGFYGMTKSKMPLYISILSDNVNTKELIKNDEELFL